MKVSVSGLAAMNRCGEQHRRQLEGDRGPQLSRTAFGSVMHHALHIGERTGDWELAVNTFQHYWHPLNIEEICEPVQIWVAKDSYGALNKKGVETLRRYADLKRFDDEELLALEYEFRVPVPGTLDEETGEPHELHGFVDRLALRYYNRRLVLCLDDFKTGKKKTYLKHNIQGTGYALASMTSEFWLGNPEHGIAGFGPERGEALRARLMEAPRRFWWINVMGGPDWMDGGFREARDYRRLVHAINTYVRARQQGIFQLNIEGEVCEFCPFRDDCPEGIDREASR